MTDLAMELARRWWEAEGDDGHVETARAEGGYLVFTWRQPGALPGGRDNRGTARLQLDSLCFRIDNPREKA